MNTIKKEKVTNRSKSDIWFEDLIYTINRDKLIYDTEGINFGRLKQIYNTFIFGTEKDMITLTQGSLNRQIIGKMIIELLKELSERKINYNKFAIDYNNQGLLTWFQIENDDYNTEKEIILAAAKVSMEFYDIGYSITNSIVEESDNLKIPTHYQVLK